MNSILKSWRAGLPPNPSASPIVSFPPVPVLQPLFFQQLSAFACIAADMVFQLFARYSAARATLSCALLVGSVVWPASA